MEMFFTEGFGVAEVSVASVGIFTFKEITR